MSRVSTGTTTLGIVCKDGILLATDTRATMGTFIAHKRAKKVFKITNHLAMTIAGGVAVAQKVVDILRANSTLFSVDFDRPISVSAAARLVSNILFSNREAGAPLPLQLLIGGVDKSGPHLFSLDPYGSLTEEKCVSTGSGSPVAYGVLEDEYQENRSIKEMIPIVVRAVNSAMKRDSASGDSFDVAFVTKEGYGELTEEEKKTVLNARKERAQ
jgi:proteasome beta subunit